MKKLKVYKVEYASYMFRDEVSKTNYIYSDVRLNPGDFVIVENKKCGIFIGKVINYEKDYDKKYSNDEIKYYIEYRFIQKIDLSNYLDSLEREKKKEELEEKMRNKFKEVDEKLKFKFYADMDEDFKKLYEEYKNL